MEPQGNGTGKASRISSSSEGEAQAFRAQVRCIRFKSIGQMHMKESEHVYLYACRAVKKYIYICMHVCNSVCMYVRVCGWLYIYIYECVDVFMFECMYVCVCVHVHTYIHTLHYITIHYITLDYITLPVGINIYIKADTCTCIRWIMPVTVLASFCCTTIQQHVRLRGLGLSAQTDLIARASATKTALRQCRL